jgi:hypothetical protein
MVFLSDGAPFGATTSPFSRTGYFSADSVFSFGIVFSVFLSFASSCGAIVLFSSSIY